MLITNGNSMMGTVYDDVNKMAMRLRIGNIPNTVTYEIY